jgi:hypothetical protein
MEKSALQVGQAVSGGKSCVSGQKRQREMHSEI